VGGQRHAPTSLPPGKTRYALCRRLGGPQSRSGRVRKISPLPGFDPPTLQPVASRYTDWANPAPSWVESIEEIEFIRLLIHDLHVVKGQVLRSREVTRWLRESLDWEYWAVSLIERPIVYREAWPFGELRSAILCFLFEFKIRSKNCAISPSRRETKFVKSVFLFRMYVT